MFKHGGASAPCLPATLLQHIRAAHTLPSDQNTREVSQISNLNSRNIQPIQSGLMTYKIKIDCAIKIQNEPMKLKSPAKAKKPQNLKDGSTYVFSNVDIDESILKACDDVCVSSLCPAVGTA